MPRWRALARRAGRTRVLRASEDAVGLPAGQMGNSEVGHLNLGAGRPGAPGPAADRRRDRRRLVLRAPGARRRLRAGAGDRAACTSSASSGPAASTPTTATSSPSSSWPHALGVPSRPDPRPARRPRHAAALGARVHARPRGAARRRPPRRPDRHRRRPLLRDGPRQALGARRARLRRDRPRGGGARARRATAAIEAAYARGENDEFVAPDGHRRRRRRRSATATRSSTATSAPTGPAS